MKSSNDRIPLGALLLFLGLVFLVFPIGGSIWPNIGIWLVAALAGAVHGILALAFWRTCRGATTAPSDEFVETNVVAGGILALGASSLISFAGTLGVWRFFPIAGGSLTYMGACLFIIGLSPSLSEFLKCVGKTASDYPRKKKPKALHIFRKGHVTRAGGIVRDPMQTDRPMLSCESDRRERGDDNPNVGRRTSLFTGGRK